MSHSYAPDLYKHMKLDSNDESAALGILLAARDADFESHGVTANDPRRKEIQLCYAILSKPEVRKHYDDAITAGRRITWPEIEHLANFGTWPDPATRVNPAAPQPQTRGWSSPQGVPQQGPQRQAPQNFAPQNFAPQPQPQQQPQFNQQPNQAPYAQPQSAQSPYAQPFNPYQQKDYQHQQMVPQPQQAPAFHHDPAVAQRPSSGARIGMALMDWIIIGAIPTVMVANESIFGALIAGIIAVLLFVGTEVTWGGSPSKLMLGYRVRDVNTHEKLSWKQSLKRQWFRSILIVPGFGQTVGFIGALATSFTITPENGLRGAHDRMADAEVIKKQ